MYDLKKLHEISMGNDAFVNQMLETFMENVTRDIEVVRTHRAAENWSAVAEKAHKLASNFAYLNALGLKKQASGIERDVVYEGNLTGIAEKTDRLSADTAMLLEQLKQDFDFLRTNKNTC